MLPSPLDPWTPGPPSLGLPGPLGAWIKLYIPYILLHITSYYAMLHILHILHILLLRHVTHITYYAILHTYYTSYTYYFTTELKGFASDHVYMIHTFSNTNYIYAILHCILIIFMLLGVSRWGQSFL